MDFLKHTTRLPRLHTTLNRDTAEQALIQMSLRIIKTETKPCEGFGDWLTTYTVTDCKGDSWEWTARQLREIIYHNYTSNRATQPSEYEMGELPAAPYLQ
jgi:hypothetical protein